MITRCLSIVSIFSGLISLRVSAARVSSAAAVKTSPITYPVPPVCCGGVIVP